LVVANRLSAIQNNKVLVLEAGDTGDGNIDIQVPLLGVAAEQPGTALDWNHTTTSQKGFNNRAIPYQRGHVLGGSSAISAYSHDGRVHPLNPDIRSDGVQFGIKGRLRPHRKGDGR
jgi:choline dehydrogenase-like flavoprotein